VQIIQHDNAVEITSSAGNEIFKAEVYNVQGSLIYSWIGEGRNNITVDRKYFNDAIYIFQVNNLPYKKRIL
jgi:hypothetical protein